MLKNSEKSLGFAMRRSRGSRQFVSDEAKLTSKSNARSDLRAAPAGISVPNVKTSGRGGSSNGSHGLSFHDTSGKSKKLINLNAEATLEIQACMNYILNQVEEEIEEIENNRRTPRHQRMAAGPSVSVPPIKAPRLFMKTEIEQIQETGSIEEQSQRASSNRRQAHSRRGEKGRTSSTIAHEAEEHKDHESRYETQDGRHSGGISVKTGAPLSRSIEVTSQPRDSYNKPPGILPIFSSSRAVKAKELLQPTGTPIFSIEANVVNKRAFMTNRSPNPVPGRSGSPEGHIKPEISMFDKNRSGNKQSSQKAFDTLNQGGDSIVQIGDEKISFQPKESQLSLHEHSASNRGRNQAQNPYDSKALGCSVELGESLMSPDRGGPAFASAHRAEADTVAEKIVSKQTYATLPQQLANQRNEAPLWPNNLKMFHPQAQSFDPQPSFAAPNM